MAFNRNGRSRSRRLVLVSFFVCSMIAVGLVGWNVTTAPTLASNVRHSDLAIMSDPDFNGTNQSSSQDSPSNPGGVAVQAQPGAAAKAVAQAQQNPNLALLNQTAPGPAATATPGSMNTAPSDNAIKPPAPGYLSLLPDGNVPPAVAHSPNKLDASKLAPNVSYNDSLNSKDLTGPAIGKIEARGGELVDSQGNHFFVSGINYEGHTDRAWMMWQNEKFDPNLIDKNFATAQDGGFNAVRIFVQGPLRDDVAANNWYKLDKVVELAQKHNLRLLITSGDYYEPDLTKLMATDRAIAQHLSGSSTILGYDLRNEPQISELAGAIYPDGQQPPLQSDVLLKFYGERMTQAQTDAWRNGAGRNIVPGYMNSRQAYIYANVLQYHDEFAKDMGNWIYQHDHVTAFDFYNSVDAVKWNAWVGALNATLQKYIDLRQGAIQSVDPGRLITIGWNRVDLVYLPANRSLGFISYHNFPGDQAGGLAQTLAILNFLKNYYSSKPVVMEEFGYSNSDGKNSVPMLRTASYETSVWLFLYGRGYAGGFKWMLNNFSIGANPYENQFGLTDDNYQPKPAYYAEQALLQMVGANRTPSGDFSRLETYDGVTIYYNWASNNAFFGNNRDFKDSRVQISQQDDAPWAVWWPNNGRGNVSVSLTVPGQVTLDMAALFPGWGSGTRLTLSQQNGTGVGFRQLSDTVISFQAQPGQVYTLNTDVQPGAFQRAQPLNTTNNTYFPQTGHNLSNIFKRYWEQHGGLSLYGYPVSEEFQENGYTVQYFERARFEYHPENSGTPNEVQLGLLGNLLAGGRREAGEKPFQPTSPTPNTATSVYFAPTGHTLEGGFKAFWEQNGGLAQFGYPISEEFPEVNPADGKVYTVQYFERNRFEYHPEFKGTRAEYQLGLLGLQVLKARGWLS